MKPVEHWPRQPAVGLALAAMSGIAMADYFPLSLTLSTAALLLGAVLVVAVRSSLATYLFIASTFFATHSLSISDSPGQRLVQELGNDGRAITAHGYVTSEPKISPKGTATFLLSLKSIQIDDVVQETRAKLLVRWKRPVE